MDRWETVIRRVLEKAAREGIVRAKALAIDRAVYGPDRDGDRPGRSLTQDEVIHLLAELGEEDAAKRVSPVKFSDPTIRADVEAQLVIEGVIRDFRPGVRFIGEDLDAIEQLDGAAEGDLAAVVDPIDGSRSYQDLLFGWVTSIQVVQFVHGEWAHLAAIIAADNGLFLYADSLWAISFGDLFQSIDRRPSFSEEGKLVTITQILTADNGASPAVSIVAQKPSDRRLSERLQAQLPDWTVYSHGGNTSALGIIAGNISAAVRLKPAATWDSLFVPFAATLDAFVGDLRGRRIPLAIIYSWFTRIRVGADSRTVPPLVVAKTRDAYLHVLAQLRWSGTVRAEPFRGDEGEFRQPVARASSFRSGNRDG